MLTLVRAWRLLFYRRSVTFKQSMRRAAHASRPIYPRDINKILFAGRDDLYWWYKRELHVRNLDNHHYLWDRET